MKYPKKRDFHASNLALSARGWVTSPLIASGRGVFHITSCTCSTPDSNTIGPSLTRARGSPSLRTMSNSTPSTTAPCAGNHLPPNRLNSSADKHQPWRAVWPSPRESNPQAQIYGFKRGEIMVFDGNAGSFFTKDGWKVEQESGK